jgi:hypothetical protein
MMDKFPVIWRCEEAGILPQASQKSDERAKLPE